MAKAKKHQFTVEVESSDHRWMSIETAAAYADISQATFLKLVEEGKFPKPFNVYSLVRWSKYALDAAMSEFERGADERNTMHDALDQMGM